MGPERDWSLVCFLSPISFYGSIALGKLETSLCRRTTEVEGGRPVPWMTCPAGNWPLGPALLTHPSCIHRGAGDKWQDTAWDSTQKGQDAWEAAGSHLEGLREQLLFWKAWPLACENRRVHFIQLGDALNGRTCPHHSFAHLKFSLKLPPSLFNQTLAFFLSQWLRQGQQLHHKACLSLLGFHHS